MRLIRIWLTLLAMASLGLLPGPANAMTHAKASGIPTAAIDASSSIATGHAVHHAGASHRHHLMQHASAWRTPSIGCEKGKPTGKCPASACCMPACLKLAGIDCVAAPVWRSLPMLPITADPARKDAARTPSLRPPSLA